MFELFFSPLILECFRLCKLEFELSMLGLLLLLCGLFNSIIIKFAEELSVKSDSSALLEPPDKLFIMFKLVLLLKFKELDT